MKDTRGKYDVAFLVWLFLVALMVIFLAGGCSPGKRLARLIEKNPELVSRDTVFHSDTTILPGVRVDTSFLWKHLTDTVTIEKDNLKIKIVRSFDTVRVYADVKADTIIKEIPVTVNAVNPVKYVGRVTWWQCFFIWLGYIFCAAVLVMVAISIIKKVNPFSNFFS